MFQVADNIPELIKQRTIDALNLLERATEEQDIVQEEMHNTVKYMKYQESLIEEKFPAELSSYEKGLHLKWCE